MRRFCGMAIIGLVLPLGNLLAHTITLRNESPKQLWVAVYPNSHSQTGTQDEPHEIFTSIRPGHRIEWQDSHSQFAHHGRGDESSMRLKKGSKTPFTVIWYEDKEGTKVYRKDTFVASGNTVVSQ